MSVDPIHSARLTLRAFEQSDAAFVRALLNDPDWIRFIGDRGVRTEADAARAIEDKYRAAYRRDGFGLMLVERRADSMPIGMCGLIRRAGLSDVDIGFAFLPEFRGDGYAFEAARAALAHGREVLGLSRVVAITLPENLASSALLKRLGFGFESSVTLPTDPQPLVLYALDLGSLAASV